MNLREIVGLFEGIGAVVVIVASGFAGDIEDAVEKRSLKRRASRAHRCSGVVDKGCPMRRKAGRMRVRAGKVRRSMCSGLRWWVSDLAVDSGKDFYTKSAIVSKIDVYYKCAITSAWCELRLNKGMLKLSDKLRRCHLRALRMARPDLRHGSVDPKTRANCCCLDCE